MFDPMSIIVPIVFIIVIGIIIFSLGQGFVTVSYTHLTLPTKRIV